MLVSRRRRKETGTINVYLNNKKLEQVPKIKYLGIILDPKFTFKDHIVYVTERCAKIIHFLARAAKVSWGIKYEAKKTIYTGAILPLLQYGAPVWIEAMKLAYNRRRYIRVQRLINIRTAKAFRTTSSGALCILTGVTTIIIKIEESVRLYKARNSPEYQTHEIDTAVKLQNWPHQTECCTITETDSGNESSVHTLYTEMVVRVRQA